MTDRPPRSLSDRATSRPVAAGAAVLALGAAVLLPLLRQTGTHSWDTVWAEDGWVYFQQAHDHGLSVLLRGFAGYLELHVRLLAAPTTLIPVRDLALYFALVSAILGALLAWFVYWASEGWVGSRAARLALASLVVLMPALGQENTATLVNSIWVLAAVTPWAFLARSESASSVVLRSAIAFFSASATLLSVVFLPFAIGLAVVRRTRPSIIVTSAFLTGLALQVLVWTHTSQKQMVSVRSWSEVPKIVGVRAFDQFLVGDRGIVALWDHRVIVVGVLPILVLAALLTAMIGVGRRRQVLALAFIGLAIVALLVPVVGRGTNHTAIEFPATTFFGPVPQAGEYQPTPARYSIVSVLMLASAAAVLVTARRPSRPRLRRGLTAAFVVQVAVVIVVGFSVTNARSRGPEWSATVDAARARCARRAPAAKVELELTMPMVNPPVVVACRDLAPAPGPSHTDGEDQ